MPDSGTPPQKFSGLSLLAVGQSDLGKGWTARANINYITSFRFRQEWSESYSDIIGSEIHSVGFVNKNWSTFTVNAIFARLQNFQSSEINTDRSRRASQLRGQRGHHPQTPRSGIHQPPPAIRESAADLFFVRVLVRPAVPLRSRCSIRRIRFWWTNSRRASS